MSKRISDVNIDKNKLDQEINQLENWYAHIQSSYLISEVDGQVGNSLLDSQTNLNQPIHSWYVLKEAYSSEFPIWVVKRLIDKYGASITYTLDPFVGCGTSGVSLSFHGIRVDGIEYNPFIRFAAFTKARVGQIDKQCVSRAIENLRSSPTNGEKFSWPELSTFYETSFFRPEDIHYLRHILYEIDFKVECLVTRDFLKLGIAKSLDTISNLHKDGRALRYKEKLHRPTAQEALPNIWNNMLSHLPNISSKLKLGEFKVYGGSATNFSYIWPASSNTRKTVTLPTNTYDLVLYSPPYLNNFDYTEIYKLELWMLDFVSTYEQWRELRRSTIRSHHSLRFYPDNQLRINENALEICEWINFMVSSSCLVGETAKHMPMVIQGYFDDMYLSLKEQFRILKPGGFLVYVVANSRHAYLPVATDIILGQIAQIVGFEPLELVVLKKRNGRTRQKNFLRESVVFMRKPA